MKTHFKRWKDDIRKYWDKTSLLGRIAIGAVISFIIAILLLRGVIKPQRKKLDTLDREASKIVPVTIDEIKNAEHRLVNLKKSQESWNKRLALAKNSGIPLGEEAHLTVINAIDSMLGDYRIFLKVRQDIEDEPVKKKAKTRVAKKKAKGKTKVKTKVKNRELCGYFRHKYETYSRFKNIFLFLKNLQKLPYLFEMENVSICEVKEEKLKDRGLLKFQFEIKVIYLNMDQLRTK